MLDLWIVGVFLAITLIVGIWQSKGITSLNVFSLANRNYSTAILVATMTATFLTGGSALGNAEKTFKYGLIFLIAPLGDIIYSLILASVVAPRIDKFRGCISIGDMLGKSYGKAAKIIVGITGTLYCITSVGAQASAIGYIFHYFLGFSHLNGILIGLGIIIIYSSTGGMKAVTITDVLQFIVLMIAVPMVCNLGLSKIGGYNALYNYLSDSKNINFSSSTKDVVKNIDIFLIFAFTVIGPSTVPRLLMAKNAKQAVQASYYSSMIYVIFFSLISIIGLSAKILKPDLDPVLAMPYIINLLPIGFRGLAVAGLIAIVMSTADSVINVASVLLVNDIIVPLSRNNLSEETKLKIARVSTVFIGIFAIIAAVSLKSVFDIMVLSFTIWSPIVVVPFLFAILGFRSDKRSFFISAAGGCLTVILWKLFKLEDHIYFSETLPGMFGNAIFFFGSHYYYKYLKPEKLDLIPALINPNEPTEGKKKHHSLNLGLALAKNPLLNFWLKIREFSLINFSYNKVKEYGAS